jgi:hypothetical protein
MSISRPERGESSASAAHRTASTPDNPAAKSRSDTWLNSSLLVVAAIATGAAIQQNNGALSPAALLLVTIALVGCLAAVTLPTARWIERFGDQPAMFLLGLGLVYQVATILTNPAGLYLRGSADATQRHHWAVAAAALLAAAGLSWRPWLGRLRIPLLLVVYFYLGTWLIKESPQPRIDVYAWHNEAFTALSQRTNPYAVNMPNIYGFTSWYGPGLADGQHVSVGFPYPPLSLLLAWLGHFAGGDYRYAMLLAITLSGAFLAYARPGRLGESAAALFLLTPRGLLVLEQGWTEPLVVLLLSATVFCACRAPRLLPLALGLFLAIKQYAIFVVPIAAFLLGRRRSGKKYAELVLKSGAIAAIVTVPMALWKLRSFIDSVILFQGRQPFRGDALSYLAWSARDWTPRLPLWTNFAMVLVALALAFWRSPRTPAGFAASSSFVFLVFFAFAKQAFCNYYFMILGAICCAIAALHAPYEPTS